jgi:hypothetical protein
MPVPNRGRHVINDISHEKDDEKMIKMQEMGAKTRLNSSNPCLTCVFQEVQDIELFH